MKLALDTNAYTNLMRGDADIAAATAAAELIVIPFVVLAELRAGFAVGSRGAENEHSLALFLSNAKVKVYFADEGTVTQYATIYKQLRGAGKKIPTNDMWVAAIAIEHGLALSTRDAHFDGLPQLTRA